MEANETPQRAAARKAVEDLHALVHVDTLFGDVYLARARELLGPHLGEADHRALARAQAEADLLPDRIRGAMGVPDWKAVQELSARLATIRRRLHDSQEIRAVAEKVYDFDEVLLDPFSTGLRALAGVPASGLPALRETGLRRLDQLRAVDPGRAGLYAARERALRAVVVDTGVESVVETGASAAALQEQAMEALARGDLRAVQEISARLQRGEGAAAATVGEEPRREGSFFRDLTHVFPDATLAKARAVGLAPVHMRPVQLELVELFRNAWRPREPVGESAGGGTVRISASLPSEVPEALRDHLEMYLDRPFVNSGGGRYLPPLGDEDVLVEDFDERPPGGTPANLPLLSLLGLDRRTGLSRARVDRALLANGHRAVEAAGLDPFAFRLVCAPPDVYVRVGSERGWGTQPQWTHLDGHMLQNRKWLALAGGDTRFGGVYDLVGLDRENDLDNLTLRFAVVQRRRLSGWPEPPAA
jgi:hypothetical protein